MYNLKDELIELMEDRMNMMPKQFFNVTVSYRDQGLVKEMNFEEYDSIPYYPRVSSYLNFMEEKLKYFTI